MTLNKPLPLSFNTFSFLKLDVDWNESISGWESSEIHVDDD